MTENEGKNPTGDETQENPQDVEVSADMLNQKMTELANLEKKIFNADGKIGGASNDTIIDKEYNKSIEQANNLKTKIELVNRLLIDFGQNENIRGLIKNVQSSKYIDNQDKERLNTIQQKLEELMRKNPDMKEEIKKFMLGELNKTNFNVNFYEVSGKEEHAKAIPIFLKSSYDVILNRYIPSLEKYIYDIKVSKQITDKKGFLNYIIQDNNFIHIGEGGLGNKLNSLFKYSVIKEGFCDDEKAPNYKTTFGYGTLLRFFEMDNSQLQKLDTLYNTPGKEADFVKLLDTLPFELKEGLLSVQKIKNIYLNEKRNVIFAWDKNNSSNLLPENAIIDFHNITDTEAKKTILGYIKEIRNSNQSNQLSPSLGIQLKLQQSQKIFDIKNFITDGGMLDNFINAQSNIFDKINIIKVFSEIISTEYNVTQTSFPLGENDINSILLDKINKLNTTEEETIENQLQILKKKYENNPETRLKIENDLKRSGGKGPESVNNKLYVIRTYGDNNRTTQYIRPQEPNQKPETINKAQVKEANATLNKIGAGGKFQVDENGKMVSSKYLEKKQQAIAKGETPPKEEKIHESILLGRKGQIEFGTNGEMVFTSSLGYKFELENNIYDINKALEITKTFDYIDKIGLGYFGNNLKGMIESIGTYLPNQASFLSINEANGNFLSIYELQNIIIPIFQNIGFIEKSQNIDQLAPEQMTDTVMSHRVSKIPGGEAFLKGKSFNKALFGELLQNTNKV